MAIYCSIIRPWLTNYIESNARQRDIIIRCRHRDIISRWLFVISSFTLAGGASLTWQPQQIRPGCYSANVQPLLDVWEHHIKRKYQDARKAPGRPSFAAI